MYLGRVVETGDTEDVFSEPRHPYTRALWASIPVDHPWEKSAERFVVSGAPPDPANIPTGCSFHQRCPLAQERCRNEEPQLEAVNATGHYVACHFRDDLELLRQLPIHRGQAATT